VIGQDFRVGIVRMGERLSFVLRRRASRADQWTVMGRFRRWGTCPSAHTVGANGVGLTDVVPPSHPPVATDLARL